MAYVVQDALASLSPWNTQVTIANQCNTPVLMFLARDAKDPQVENSYEITVPAGQDHLINSGWLHEPRATLLIRTGLREAKVLRASNSCRITVSLAPHGLHVESLDNLVVEDFVDAAAVPGNNTVPMLVRGEHFEDVREGQPQALQRQRSPLGERVHDALAKVSPWSTQVTVTNQCSSPVRLFLARDAERPSANHAQDFTVPGDSKDFPIQSGWLREPRATLLIRTGLREAKLLHAACGGRIVVSLAPHGLKVESVDDVRIHDFGDAAAVPGYDTAPMLLRGESFGSHADAHPAAQVPADDAKDRLSEMV